MVKLRQYDEEGRKRIREYLADCKVIADLGCNAQKIRDDAIGYDVDVGHNPDKVVDFNDPVFTFYFGETYDGICMSHLLEHVIDTRYFLRQCFNSLNKNGRIAMICPDGEGVEANTLGDSCNTHEMLFTPITLKLYLENAGFKEVQTRYYNRPKAYKKTKGIFACGVKNEK